MSATSRTFSSGIAGQLGAFVRQRMASGCWNDTYAENLRLFDLYCSRADPSATTLSQATLDGWCEMRDTESPHTCYTRTVPARAFADYARQRGLTDAVPPEARYVRDPVSVPHAFTDGELERFFEACDTIVPYRDRPESVLRKVTCPAFFRLLYSSGMRTTEARLLRRPDVDLAHGVIDVRRSKGHDQHYVALHESMTSVLRDYDAAAERLQPGREWFFQSPRGGCYDRGWVSDNFKRLWERANGDADGVVPYHLRHYYATENIMSWDCDPYEAHDRLLFLSKSMGHRDVGSTLYYLSIVPALADKMRRLTEATLNATVPEVWDD